MKRRTIHLIFGTLSIACAGAVAFSTLSVTRTTSSNQIVKQLNQKLLRNETSTNSTNTALLLAAPSDSLNVALAKAGLLAKSGEFDVAAKAYSEIIRNDPEGSTGLAARLNMGNMFMRRGIRSDSAGAPSSLAMIELAKQRYRDLLQISPNDWDARYNLERALRLAPEGAAPSNEGKKDIKERRRVKLRGMSSVRLP